MIDSFYTNIGGKIKALAKGTFIIEAIASIVIGIAMAIKEDVVLWTGTVLMLTFQKRVEGIPRLCTHP